MNSPWLSIHYYKASVMVKPAKITLNVRQHSHEDTKFGLLQTQKAVVLRFLAKFCFYCLVTFLREDRYGCDIWHFFKNNINIKLRHNWSMNSHPANESKLLLNIQSCTSVSKETEHQFLLRTQYPFSKEITFLSPKGRFLANSIVAIA